jgi:hypothetical protein
MTDTRTAEMIAEGLTAPEHIMLACIAFLPRWQKAAVAPSLTRQLFVHGLVEPGAGGYVLTAQGRAVLAALMMRAATREGA